MKRAGGKDSGDIKPKKSKSGADFSGRKFTDKGSAESIEEKLNADNDGQETEKEKPEQGSIIAPSVLKPESESMLQGNSGGSQLGGQNLDKNPFAAKQGSERRDSKGTEQATDSSPKEEKPVGIKDINKFSFKWFHGVLIRSSGLVPINSPTRVGKKVELYFQDQESIIKGSALYEAAKNISKLTVEHASYSVRNFSVKEANATYNGSGHQYELNFDRNTTIELIDAISLANAVSPIPWLTWSAAKSLPPNKYFHIAGTIAQIYEKKTVSSKKDVSFIIQTVEIYTSDGDKIDVKIWGHDADVLQEDENEGENIKIMFCKLDVSKQPVSVNASGSQIYINDVKVIG